MAKKKMKRRKYSLLRHLNSLCLMTHSGIEVKITRFSKKSTKFVLRGKLKTECKTPPRNLCWTQYGRYWLGGDSPLDLYVFREGESFDRLDLPSEINRLKLQTRGFGRKVVITDVLGAHFPIKGYIVVEKKEGEPVRTSWTPTGSFFTSGDSPLDLMEVINE